MVLADYIGQPFRVKSVNNIDLSRALFRLEAANLANDSGLLYSFIKLSGNLEDGNDAVIEFSAGDSRYPDIRWPIVAVKVPNGFYIESMPRSLHGDREVARWAEAQRHETPTICLS